MNPTSSSKRTVNCGFSVPVATSLDWQSFGDQLDRIHLDLGPLEYFSTSAQQAESPYLDPYVEANREGVARSFLGEGQCNLRQAGVLYDLLLGTTAPDSTVAQNLAAGQSTESQIALLVTGADFFALSNNNNSNFVSNLYNRLLDRAPSQSELNSTVADLNGYLVWVEDPCDPKPEPCPIDDYCDPPPPCGHWEWFNITRDDVAWQLLGSHEFDQRMARLAYGVQLRRDPTSSEVEDLAYYIGLHGMKEGAVRILKSSEFFNASTRPW